MTEPSPVPSAPEAPEGATPEPILPLRLLPPPPEGSPLPFVPSEPPGPWFEVGAPGGGMLCEGADICP